jgi:hypothetical protein
MIALLAGLAALIAVMAVLHAVINTRAQILAAIVKWTGIAIAIAAAIWFLLRGSSGLGLASAALAAMFYFRQFAALRNAAGWRGGPGGRPAGQTTDVETEWLRMSLDLDSGEAEGVVLKGRYAGAKLGELDFPQLMEVLGEARINDPQAAQLLEAYLARAHADRWEEKGGEDGGGDRDGEARGGPMTRDQALEILGLEPGATDADIREAYKRLMMNMHPDRGGSSYLAAQINAARDLLLG